MMFWSSIVALAASPPAVTSPRINRPILAGATLNVSALTAVSELLVTSAVLLTFNRPFVHLSAATTLYVASRPLRLLGASAAATGRPPASTTATALSSPARARLAVVECSTERRRPALRPCPPGPSLFMLCIMSRLRSGRNLTFAYMLPDVSATRNRVCAGIWTRSITDRELVGVEGLEPTASCSQSTCATNCATPRPNNDRGRSG